MVNSCWFSIGTILFPRSYVYKFKVCCAFFIRHKCECMHSPSPYFAIFPFSRLIMRLVKIFQQFYNSWNNKKRIMIQEERNYIKRMALSVAGRSFQVYPVVGLLGSSIVNVSSFFLLSSKRSVVSGYDVVNKIVNKNVKYSIIW